MLDALKEKESSNPKDDGDDLPNPPEGGSGSDTDNKGTLMLNATCIQSNIRYLQDFCC